MNIKKQQNKRVNKPEVRTPDQLIYNSERAPNPVINSDIAEKLGFKVKNIKPAQLQYEDK